MRSISKRALMVAAVVVASGVTFTLAAVLWSDYLVQTNSRFSVRLRPGENELLLALGRGKYLYQVTTEPILGLATLVGPEQASFSIRSSVAQVDKMIVAESNRKLQSFMVEEKSSHPLILKVVLENTNDLAVYLSFRRAL